MAEKWQSAPVILQGDCRTVLAGLEAESVQCVVTSPPYWGLRDYGVAEQLGLEATPDEYVARMVEVFREVRRVLRKDGVLWVNLGDSYATGAGHVGARPGGGAQGDRWADRASVYGGRYGEGGIGPMTQPNRMPLPGLKPKDRVGIPHRTVLALQADGWWWRDEIVWHKPNPMPSSVEDRTTPCHEMLFLLTKAERYFYDNQAIKEPAVYAGPNGPGTCSTPYGQGFTRRDKQSETSRQRAKGGDRWSGFNERWDSQPESPLTRNRRSVWTIPTTPYPEAHFAVFPEALVKPCVLAGSRPGDTVLDPFAGSGTVGVVAKAFGREFVGVELNPAYVAMAERRIAAQNPALPFGLEVA